MDYVSGIDHTRNARKALVLKPGGKTFVGRRLRTWENSRSIKWALDRGFHLRAELIWFVSGTSVRLLCK
jgi:hypothetical protein